MKTDYTAEEWERAVREVHDFRSSANEGIPLWMVWRGIATQRQMELNRLRASHTALLEALENIHSQVHYEIDKGGGIFSTRDARQIDQAIAAARQVEESAR